MRSIGDFLLKLLASVANDSHHIAELLFDIPQHAIGVLVGSGFNLFGFSQGASANLFEFLLRLTLHLFDFGDRPFSSDFTIGLNLLAQAIGFHLRLSHQPHFIEDAGGLLFGGVHNFSSVLFRLAENLVFLANHLFGFLKRRRKVETNRVENIEKRFLIYQRPPRKRNAGAVENRFLKSVERLLNVDAALISSLLALFGRYSLGGFALRLGAV